MSAQTGLADPAAAEALAAYNALLASDEAGAGDEAGALELAFVRAGITFDGQPMRSFLRPHLVGSPAWARLRADGVRLLELCARVARQAFGGDVGALCAYLGTPAAEARWVAHDPGAPDVLLSRLDAFTTPQGPRFIEINSDAPAGFGYSDRMAAVFQDLPVFQRFAAQRRVSYEPSGVRLVEALLESAHRAGLGRNPRVAIVDWADVKTLADQEILRAAFETAGIACVLADPRACELRAGRLHTPDGVADLVYRRGVLSELVEREDEVRGFLDAYRTGAALYANSFRCRLSEDKAFFALLSDEDHAHLLAADEHAFVARVVPWTRRLDERRTLGPERQPVELIPFVLAERERLVLKPAHGYGGQAVLIGDETSEADWMRAVEAGLGQPWVAQQRVSIPSEPFPVFAPGGALRFVDLKVNTNPFYVAGHDVGAVTRASLDSVINVSAGGGSVPTFVVA